MCIVAWLNSQPFTTCIFTCPSSSPASLVYPSLSVLSLGPAVGVSHSISAVPFGLLQSDPVCALALPRTSTLDPPKKVIEHGSGC